MNHSLYERLKNTEGLDVFNGFVHFKEAVNETIRYENIDLLITSDLLEGSSLTNESYVQEIRSKNPNTRIIFLLNDVENRTKFKRFLFSLSIFDVIDIKSGLDLNNLVSIVKNPLSWSDVYHYYDRMSSEDLYALNEEVFEKSDENSPSPREFDDFRLEAKEENILFQ